MDAKLFLKLIASVVLMTGCLSAGTAYSIPSGYSDSDGAVSGYVDFYLSACVTTPTPSCTLNIAITDTAVNPRGAGQLISGLSFNLTNAGTTLTGTGSLSGTINNNSNGNGTGGAVTVVNSSLQTSTTTTTPSRWKFGTVAQEKQGITGFDLTTLTGGSPQDMIIAAGSYTNANSSIKNHSNSLAGTVDFTISNFAGLTTSTVLSSVEFYFGTGPDANVAGACTSGCTGGVIATSQTAAPEPVSMTLAGGGLMALAMIRRRCG